jgi:hypothetical protein
VSLNTIDRCIKGWLIIIKVNIDFYIFETNTTKIFHSYLKPNMILIVSITTNGMSEKSVGDL